MGEVPEVVDKIKSPGFLPSWWQWCRIPIIVYLQGKVSAKACYQYGVRVSQKPVSYSCVGITESSWRREHLSWFLKTDYIFICVGANRLCRTEPSDDVLCFHQLTGGCILPLCFLLKQAGVGINGALMISIFYLNSLFRWPIYITTLGDTYAWRCLLVENEQTAVRGFLSLMDVLQIP